MHRTGDRLPLPRRADPTPAGCRPCGRASEQVRLTAELAAFKAGKFAHHAAPDAIVSPDGVLGEEERDRLERQWNDRLQPRWPGGGRRHGGGCSRWSTRWATWQRLADLRATKEDICNAFGVPVAFLTSQTNLANLQAAEQQHLAQTIRPRLLAWRDEKLNEQLVPRYDPTGRLFLAMATTRLPGNRELLLLRSPRRVPSARRADDQARSAPTRACRPSHWGDEPRRSGGAP
ncbi:MAG: phage portal protein [Gemmataceae bacterium]